MAVMESSPTPRLRPGRNPIASDDSAGRRGEVFIQQASSRYLRHINLGKDIRDLSPSATGRAEGRRPAGVPPKIV